MAKNYVTLLVAIVGMLSAVASAQSPDIEGHWQGNLATGLRVGLRVTRSASGDLEATLDIIDRARTGMSVRRVTLSGLSVTFEIPAVNATYAGTVTTDGNAIAGTMTETPTTVGRPVSRPLTFTRVDLVATLVRPQSPRAPFPYDSIDVVYDNPSGGVKLAGTLTRPSSGDSFPAAILISGSGPQDRDETLAGHKPMLVVADYLTKRGVAVLRVDDRGVGLSTGKYAQATLNDMAEDVLASVDYLRSRPEIDASRIGVIGHSSGGRIAAVAASRSTSLAFVVMLGGPGLTLEQTILSQREAVLRVQGGNDDAVAKDRAIVSMILRVLKDASGETAARANVIREWTRIKTSLPENQRLEADRADAYVERLAAGFNAAELRSDLSADPAVTLRQLKVPVLALNGARDLQVLARHHLPAIASALSAGGNSDFTVAALPGLNHLFQCMQCTIDEYGKLEETFSPMALEVMGDWLIRHARPTPAPNQERESPR